jgi:hypothetical protein
MTSIVSYDSANWKEIPHNAPAVLPYVDGRYAYTHKAFPQSRYRYITVFGSWREASIFDIEPGCIWPPSAARYPVSKRAEIYHDAIVYTFPSAVAEVQAALQGITYGAILATYGTGQIIRHYQGWTLNACQYQGGPTAPFDRSYWFDENDLRKP